LLALRAVVIVVGMKDEMTETRIILSADWLPVWRARLVELALSYREAEGLAGLSEGHLAKILCGMRKPSGETIARLCAALALVQSVSVDVDREALLRAGPVKKKRG
jgi:hypothetical protein